LFDLAEILHSDTYEGPRRTARVKLDTGNRILPPGDVYSKSVLGAYFAADEDIFTNMWNCPNMHSWKIQDGGQQLY